MIPETIEVRILKDIAWAKKGTVVSVDNTICYHDDRPDPLFLTSKGALTVKCEFCEILDSKDVLPKYTIEDLEQKIGHKFELVLPASKLVCDCCGDEINIEVDEILCEECRDKLKC